MIDPMMMANSGMMPPGTDAAGMMPPDLMGVGGMMPPPVDPMQDPMIQQLVLLRDQLIEECLSAGV